MCDSDWLKKQIQRAGGALGNKSKDRPPPPWNLRLDFRKLLKSVRVWQLMQRGLGVGTSKHNRNPLEHAFYDQKSLDIGDSSDPGTFTSTID